MATIDERRKKAADARKKKGKKPFVDMGKPPKDSIIPDTSTQSRRKKKKRTRRA
jgi:hypothetical protein